MKKSILKAVHSGRSVTIAVTAFLASVICIAPVSAATVTPGDDLFIPSGLGFGDTYQLAFVTLASTPATSTEIAFYNNFVQTRADASTLTAGIDWFAIGSTATVDARDNALVNIGTPDFAGVFNLFGEKVADDRDDMWDGSIDNWIQYAENLAQVDSTIMWTGTDTSGAGISGNQLGATDSSMGWTGNYNFPSPGGNWIEYGSNRVSSSSLRMYALSEEITVVPIPAAAWLFGSALLGLAAIKRKQAA